MLEYKETSIFCHQLVEYDGKKFLLDASTMKPKPVSYTHLHYEDVPKSVQEEIIKKAKGEA